MYLFILLIRIWFSIINLFLQNTKIRALIKHKKYQPDHKTTNTKKSQRYRAITIKYKQHNNQKFQDIDYWGKCFFVDECTPGFEVLFCLFLLLDYFFYLIVYFFIEVWQFFRQYFVDFFKKWLSWGLVFKTV